MLNVACVMPATHRAIVVYYSIKIIQVGNSLLGERNVWLKVETKKWEIDIIVHFINLVSCHFESFQMKDQHWRQILDLHLLIMNCWPLTPFTPSFKIFNTT